jgi:hypothetical protein
VRSALPRLLVAGSRRRFVGPLLVALIAAGGGPFGLFAAAPAAAATTAPLVAAYPSPGSNYNPIDSQIAFRGIPASEIGPVSVVGSVTGAHAGQIEADPDGDGGSFLPTTPFAAGETVTVSTGLNIADGSAGKFSFTIVDPSKPILPMTLPLVSAGSGGTQYFHSRPDLVPPSVTVSKDSAPASQGDIFVAPQYGPYENGPMILSPNGQLVWFLPYAVNRKMLITDFRVQTLGTQPVLTWWQGTTNHGTGEGEGIIFNREYQQIYTVHAADGLLMDLHEFLVTPQGDAYLVAVQPVSDHSASPHKPVFDNVVQEIDIKTGLLLFQWDALSHVPLSNSYFSTKSPGFTFDPYHTNSVAVDRDGNLIISMRDTSAVYKVNRVTGQIMWQLGGKHSSFKMGKGTSAWFQHDALVQPDGSLTVFDDGGGPPTYGSAHGIRVSLNLRTMTASLAGAYNHSPSLDTNFEGNVQQLSGNDVFMGWGQQPYFSEDNGSGQQIYDAHFTVPSSSYRAYRFPWSAQPPTLPAIAVGAGSAGATNVYASWNGATDVAAWRVLAGPSSTALTGVARGSRSNFETAVSTPSQAPYYSVQALGSTGQILATSPVAAAPPRIALYGRTVFMSHGSTGAIPASCFAKQACHVSTTVYAGRTLISRTGPEALPLGHGGLLYFALTGAGRTLLAHAHGNRLLVTITARDSSGVTGTTYVNLVSYGTAGATPPRSAAQSPTVQIAGLTAFVSSSGTGGILAACYALAPCPDTATLSVHGSVIAQTGTETVGESSLGYVEFQLTSYGRSLLAHASGNQLGAQVTLKSGSAQATGSVVLVGFR